MRDRLRQDLEHQVVSLEKRVRELREESVRAARDLIASSGRERRSTRKLHLEREFRRVQGEVERLEQEAALLSSLAAENDFDRHLKSVERQLHDVLAEREEWVRESLCGRRRRAEDMQSLERLKEEQARLTAELLRCAQVMRRRYDSDEEPRIRRVWKMLRLSGS